jgi:hypothetical protein
MIPSFEKKSNKWRAWLLAYEVARFLLVFYGVNIAIDRLESKDNVRGPDLSTVSFIELDNLEACTGINDARQLAWLEAEQCIDNLRWQVAV